MPSLVMIDGRLSPAEQATVSVLDRGFLYGDSVFETVGTYSGKPFALGEHLERLEQSAERVYIQMPVSLAQLQSEVLSVIDEAGNPESYVRIMITRGRGALGLDPGLAEKPLRVIIVTPLQKPKPEAYRDGIEVISYRTQRAGDATEAAGAKIGNYLVAVLAMRAAREAGASEALVVDAAGQVLEGATSNVFAVEGGRLVTPPESAGILPGITRRHVLDVAKRAGVGVDLRPLSLDELLGADEIFISSSIRELLPVVRVDGARAGSGTPGPLTRRLLRGYREKVKESLGLSARPGPPSEPTKRDAD